ncbi:MAG: hypothetical protein IJF74_02560, partial [Clostridia bacterium]|nr:hypothetical protein [Clostridia bacterium]
MTKLDFLYDLRAALKALPKADIERYVDYYSEMIDDRIDDGMSEEAAVAELGRIEDIAAKILGDIPLNGQAEESETHEAQEAPEGTERPETNEIAVLPENAESAPKRKGGLSALAMLMIIFGAPIWVPVLISLFSVIIAL